LTGRANAIFQEAIMLPPWQQLAPDYRFLPVEAHVLTELEAEYGWPAATERSFVSKINCAALAGENDRSAIGAGSHPHPTHLQVDIVFRDHNRRGRAAVVQLLNYLMLLIDDTRFDRARSDTRTADRVDFGFRLIRHLETAGIRPPRHGADRRRAGRSTSGVADVRDRFG